MRELGGDEIARRLAIAKAREREILRRASAPPSEREEAAIAQAEAALSLVVRDIEASTSVREAFRVQRYVDWIAETPPNPLSMLAGPEHHDVKLPSDEDEGSVPVIACHWGGHSFAVNGEQTTVELVLDIAAQLQDDVIEETWAAWPRCPGHEHPMSLGVEDGVAVWGCPSEVDVFVPIGHLGEPTS